MIDQNAILLSSLKSANKIKDIVRTVEKYHKSNDLNCHEYVDSNNIAIVCRRGCTYCCNLKVDVAPHEVFLITKYFSEHLSAEKRTKLVAALKKHVFYLSKITEDDHLSMNVPCPLMSGSVCSVYPVRPFACRAYYSLGVSSCQYSFENQADLKEKRATDRDLDSQWEQVRTTVVAIFQQLGYDTTHNELGVALLYSLQHPKAASNWANKKSFGKLHTYQNG